MLIPACAARSEGCSLHLDSIDDDMLQLVLSFVDEPSDWAHAAAASRSMREAASLSNWQRRLRLHFGVDVDPSGLGLRPGDHPPFSEFRGLWRAYYDGGWTPLRVDHRLLRHLTWHALKQQHEFGKAPVAHRVEVSDGAADSDDSEGEEAWPAEARRGLRSAWLLQAAACALDPLWLTQNAPGSKAAAAVCTGAVLLDCQIDSAQPPELRRASTALLRALDACAARRLPLVADGVATGLCHVALLAVTARVAARCEEHDELSSLWAPAIDRGPAHLPRISPYLPVSPPLSGARHRPRTSAADSADHANAVARLGGRVSPLPARGAEPDRIGGEDACADHALRAQDHLAQHAREQHRPRGRGGGRSRRVGFGRCVGLVKG
mmetsp:Transcript_8164/g.24226  ORF Transcript_8164/g.24226 Transcript_8164/m.24226 type:complete len:379 (+) Transcript_8164:80-1216(+)